MTWTGVGIRVRVRIRAFHMTRYRLFRFQRRCSATSFRCLRAAMWLVAATMGSGSVMGADSHQISLKLRGIGDVRFVRTDDDLSSFDGGFGRFRYGGDGNPQALARVGQIALVGIAQITPSLLAVAHIQHNPQLSSEVDVPEAFLRYRPASSTRWRYSLKVGAFFPEVSDEQRGIAWSNIYTLSNSLANTWIAEEVRPLGGEAALEWRGDRVTIKAGAQVFFANDRQGTALAFRGWAANDQVVGLFGGIRLPDIPGVRSGAENRPFVESDDRPGYAMSLHVRHRQWGSLRLYASDNRADPAGVGSEGALWDTEFVSLAYLKTFVGGWTFSAQAMTGRTYTYAGRRPDPALPADAPQNIRIGTDFDTAALLVAKDLGGLRLAARAELFHQDDISLGPAPPLGEDGEAFTFAATYRMGSHHRLIAEVQHVRGDRMGGPLNTPITTRETQTTLAYRYVF